MLCLFKIMILKHQIKVKLLDYLLASMHLYALAATYHMTFDLLSQLSRLDSDPQPWLACSVHMLRSDVTHAELWVF